MEERPKRYRYLLALLWLPLALVLVVPAVVLLAVAFYARAALTAVVSLVRYLLTFKPPSAAATQRPHLLRVNVAAKKGQ